MSKISAGVLLYRYKDGKSEIFLVHPGGPFYKNKDDGVWDLPKGEAKEGENLEEVARREFHEETAHEVGQLEYLGRAKSSNKVVEIWRSEGDIDPEKFKSNTTLIEWPPKTGRKIEIPEVDRGEFFPLKEAKKKVWMYLVPIIEAFENKLD